MPPRQAGGQPLHPIYAHEDAWDRLRATYGSGLMPRTVNMITGPSRTGDIEQKIELGPHGPRRLHVIVVGEA